MNKKTQFIDSSGNVRNVSATYVKKQVSDDGNILDTFQDNLFDRLNKLAEGKTSEENPDDFRPDFPEGFKPYNRVWRYEPVEGKYFFQKMIGESLTDVQYEEAFKPICNDNPFKFTDLDYKTYFLKFARSLLGFY